MDFKSAKANASIFALIIISVIALGLGSLMYSNFSIYQLSKAYHISRELLLIKKMLFQITEEAILSKYELAVQSNEELENLFLKEIDSICKNTGIKFDAFKIVENHIKETEKFVFNEKFIFEKDQFLNPRLSSYLHHGPYFDYGESLFFYGIYGRTYEIKAKGYGIPLSNFDLIFYDLSISNNKTHEINKTGGLYLRKESLYFEDKDEKDVNIKSQKNDLSYKNRKDVSFFCHAYEYLWTSQYLQNLAKNSANSFILEIPYQRKLNGNGVLFNNENDITLDLGKIDFDIITISNALGGGFVKLQESNIKEKPLIIISFNNFAPGAKTLFEIDQSLKRPLIVFALNTEIKFKNKPGVRGAFFCDKDSQATGQCILDGHFSCHKESSYLDKLDLQFERTEETKIGLANFVPHVFMVDIFLLEQNE